MSAPSRTAPSSRFGVKTSASGISEFFRISAASPSKSLEPLVDTSTGSTASLISGRAAKNSATAAAVSASNSIPVFAAEGL